MKKTNLDVLTVAFCKKGDEERSFITFSAVIILKKEIIEDGFDSNRVRVTCEGTDLLIPGISSAKSCVLREDRGGKKSLTF